MNKKISNRVIEMVHPKGFDRLFEKEIRKSETYVEAFEKLNKEYESVFGETRYRNYESYRQSRRQRVKT